MTTEAITPLRQRMIEDMNARKLCAGAQGDTSAPAEKARHLSLHVDDLYPVRAIADRIALGFAELPGALVDLVDRQAVRLFT